MNDFFTTRVTVELDFPVSEDTGETEKSIPRRMRVQTIEG